MTIPLKWDFSFVIIQFKTPMLIHWNLSALQLDIKNKQFQACINKIQK